MTLYSIFIITSFILFYLDTIGTMRNRNLLTKVRVDPIFPSSTGLVFVFTINNSDDDDDFNVELSGDECCLEIGPDDVNCDVLEVIGSCVGNIPRGTTKSMRMVAPILDPFERVGYCWFHLDSKSSKRRKKSMRNRIKTNFDTRIDNKDQPTMVPNYIKSCPGIDEDPLNDCNFVDCETHYNGKRSYFDRKLRKCFNVPVCKTNKTQQLIYDKSSNKCIDKDLKKEDLDFIAQLAENKHRTTKDVIIISHQHQPNSHAVSRKYPDVEPVKERVTTETFTIDEVRHLNYPTEPFSITHIETDKSTDSNIQPVNKKTCGAENEVLIADAEKFQWFNTLVHGCSVHILLLVTFIQCCCICAMICFIPRSCNCNKRAKVIKSYFNYHHDASVTTPLIDTSNIDTETTHYTSESNIDKRIKCYKAFHRDVNVKTSLSDDILSKCITRRDWQSKSLKYPQERFKTNSDICKIQERSEHEEESSVNVDKDIPVPETQVTLENETEAREREKKSEIRKSLFRKLATKSDSEEAVPKCDSSEKEIQSHVYTEQIPTNAGFHSEITDFSKTYRPTTETKAMSMSTEKGAQVDFTNDSIDDFLSERGMIFMASDNTSKFSFTSSDVKKSTKSSDTSKTSKKNIVKNILSIFRWNPKVGPSSDPGIKKSGMDVELLHVSHASLYSSSNNISSEYYRSVRKLGDSRSSF